MGRTVIRIVVGIITVAAWSLLGFSLHGGLEPRVDVRVHEASGRLMAQQALACLETGGDITIVARDTGTFKNPATDIQLASFRKEIAKAHGTIHSFHGLRVDPLRAIAVPSSDFMDLISSTPEGSVIASFMGPPVLTAAEKARLGENRPAIVAFCSGNKPESVDLRTLFEQKLLQAAVVDRRGTGWLATEQSIQVDDPEQLFLSLNGTNLAGLPPRRETEH